MANIRRPQQAGDGGLGKLSALTSMGFGVAQMAGGNPAGAIGIAGGAKGLQNKPMETPQVGNETAMQRRAKELGATQAPPKGEDILKTLQEGQVAFNQLPPEKRQEYAEPFFKTYSSFAKDYKQGKFS